MSLRVEYQRDVAVLSLNRPQVHNAFDDDLIVRLMDAFRAAEQNPSVRVIILQGEGKSFSAGGDLNWMRRMAQRDRAANLADARQLACLMRTVDTCAKPTIAKVHGACYAGAVGLVACCDIAIAASDTVFAISEVRIGLIPSVISPYLVRAMGVRQARRWLMTAERCSAEQAKHLNLVHEVVEPDVLQEAIDACVAALRLGSPDALRATKRLVAFVDQPIHGALIDETAHRIADLRASAEGREGIAAFLEKRKPRWQE